MVPLSDVVSQKLVYLKRHGQFDVPPIVFAFLEAPSLDARPGLTYGERTAKGMAGGRAGE